METKQIIKVARALADPKRVSILLTIVRRGELSCGELASLFPIVQSTVSHHLQTLVEARLVAMRKQGQHHYFRACPETLYRLAETLQQWAESISTLPGISATAIPSLGTVGRRQPAPKPCPACRARASPRL